MLVQVNISNNTPIKGSSASTSKWKLKLAEKVCRKKQEQLYVILIQQRNDDR